MVYSYSKETERYVAVFNVAVVIFVIVWKTVGMEWMPFGFGAAWTAMFDPAGPYYPRHPDHEAEYNLFYLFFYGILGLVAQWASLFLVTNPSHKGAQRIFGVFHTVIAVYHLLFAARIVRGKLILFENGSLPPYAIYITQVLYLLELMIAVNFLFFKQQYDASQKTSLDLISASNVVVGPLYMILLRLDLGSETLAAAINGLFFVWLPYLFLLNELVAIFSGGRSSSKPKQSKD